MRRAEKEAPTNPESEAFRGVVVVVEFGHRDLGTGKSVASEGRERAVGSGSAAGAPLTSGTRLGRWAWCLRDVRAF